MQEGGAAASGHCTGLRYSWLGDCPGGCQALLTECQPPPDARDSEPVGLWWTDGKPQTRYNPRTERMRIPRAGLGEGWREWLGARGMLWVPPRLLAGLVPWRAGLLHSLPACCRSEAAPAPRTQNTNRAAACKAFPAPSSGRPALPAVHPT